MTTENYTRKNPCNPFYPFNLRFMSLQNLIRTDATAAFISAVFVLYFKTWLAQTLSLPEHTLYIMCAVSFCYAAYSAFLSLQNPKPYILLKILVILNAAWATVCITIIVYHFGTINIFGILYLFAEAVFVGGLAFLEKRKMEKIINMKS